MKIFSKNLTLFCISTFLVMVLFRILMSYFLSIHAVIAAWGTSISWGLSMFFVGWYFGKKECDELPFYQSGYRFHIATYVIFGLVSFSWFSVGMKAPQENMYQLNITMLLWGVCLLVHSIIFFINKSGAIKGLNKSEIFD